MIKIDRRSSHTELSGASVDSGFAPGILDRPFDATDVIAVEDGREQLSYGELADRVEGLAAHLRAAGVRPQTTVGVYLPRSANVVVALLAVIRAGGAYVPIDPHYPAQRISLMFDDAETSFVITTQGLRSQIPGNRHVICLDSPAVLSALTSTDAQISYGLISPDSLAYMVYTSGSTGTPKGIEVPRRSLSKLLSWQREHRWMEKPRTCQFAPTSFDVSIQEICTTLDLYGTLVMAPDEVRDDGSALLQFLLDADIERLFLPPVALRYLATAAQSRPLEGLALREVVTAGEQLLITPAIREFFSRTGCVLENQYGPSEAGVVATSFRLTGPPAHWPDRPPIGEPFSHIRARIVDEDGRPVGAGEEGELLLSGPCLALGYHRRSELTAQRFTYEFDPRVRHYRTGDQVREQVPGELEFLGRLDQQVKINGHRVELGEVEAIISRHPAVVQVVATTMVTGAGIRRLVAYVVLGTDVSVTSDEIREHARTELPEFAVPTVVMPLPELPQTPSGKADRKSLPSPWLTRAGNADYAAAMTPLQQQLIDTWEFVLGLGRIGINDDLAAIGADSLAILQLAAHVERRLGIVVNPAMLHSHPTIADLTDAIEPLTLAASAPQPSTTPSSITQLPITPSPLTTPPSFVRRQSRPLTEQISSGRLPRLDAAALSYLPTLNPAQRSRYQNWHHGHPVLTHLVRGVDGTIGLFCVPIEASELYTGPKHELVAACAEALHTAEELGARALALTGLLASALDYGADLTHLTDHNADGRGLQLTTGHATTVSAVVMNTEQLLIDTGRTLHREHVAYVGLGSIGRSALLLMLNQLSPPAQLTLCDTSSAVLDRVAAEVIKTGYRGRLTTATAVKGTAPLEVYDASLIIGATSSADAVDVRSLRPGTLVVDDSWPRSFDTDAAVARMTDRADMIATEAGELHSPSPVEEILYLPHDDLAPLMACEELIALRANPHEVMGCVSAGLFVAAYGLPTTIGLTSVDVARQHYQTLREHGFHGTSPHLTGHLIIPSTLKRFRHRYAADSVPQNEEHQAQQREME